MNIKLIVILGFVFIISGGCVSSPRQNNKDVSPLETKDVAIPQEKQTTNPPVDKLEKTTKSDPTDNNQAQDQTVKLIEPKKTEISIENRENLFNKFLEGALLEERSQYEDAGKAYAKALEIVPDSSFLGAVTGKALLQSGRVDEAIITANKAIKNNTNEEEAYKVLALAYLQKKQYDKAIEQYEKLLKIQPNSMDILSELVSLYVRTQHFQEAIQLYRNMARIDNNRAFMYEFRIALILTQMGRYQDALDEYQTVLKNIPGNFDVYLRIGKLYEILNQSDEAITTYLSALQYIRNSRDELNIRKALGPLYYERNSLLEAIHQYSRVKEIAPEDLYSQYRLAAIFFELKNYQAALDELTNLTKKEPGAFYLQILNRRAMVELQRGAEGYQIFLGGLDSSLENGNGDDIQRYLLELTRKETLNRIQEYAQFPYLQQLLEKSIATYPQKPRALFAATQISIVCNDQISLKLHLNKILADINKSQQENNREWLSLIAFELQSWFKVRISFKGALLDQLLASLNKSITDPPYDPYTTHTLGLVYMDNNQWSDSETWLLHSKNAYGNDKPGYKDCLFHLAVVYEKMTRLADIEALMQEAIEIYPDDSEAYNFLGYTYADNNIRLDEALALIQKALKLSPDDGNILDSIGWVYYRMGQITESIKFLEKAIAKDERHPVILNHLGDAYLKKGEFSTAIQYWKKSLEFGPEYPFDFTAEFKDELTKKILNTKEKQ